MYPKILNFPAIITEAVAMSTFSEKIVGSSIIHDRLKKFSILLHRPTFRKRLFISSSRSLFAIRHLLISSRLSRTCISLCAAP